MCICQNEIYLKEIQTREKGEYTFMEQSLIWKDIESLKLKYLSSTSPRLRALQPIWNR
jgi:hypothetical protein